MKIVVTAKDESLASELDPHFGRARKFILFDTEIHQIIVCEDAQNLNAAQGGGVGFMLPDSPVGRGTARHMPPLMPRAQRKNKNWICSRVKPSISKALLKISGSGSKISRS